MFAPLVFVAAASLDDLPFDRLLSRAKLDAARVDAGTLASLDFYKNKAVQSAAKGCASSTKPVPMQAVLMVEKEGKVSHVWLKEATPFALCMKQKLATEDLYWMPMRVLTVVDFTPGR